MSGLEAVQARGQRMVIGRSAASRDGATPVVERTIESQPVGRDDGQAREQVRRSRLVAQQLRQPQAPDEVGLAVTDRHTAGHRHVPAELPQGQHLQPPVTHHAGGCRSFREVSQRRRQLRRRLVRPAADDPGAGSDLGSPGPLGRLHRLGGQVSRIGDGEPAEGLIGRRQQRPCRPQPVTAGGRVPGQRFRPAGQPVSCALEVSQPGGLRGGGIQCLPDQVVGELEVAPGGHQQPRLQRPFTMPQGNRRRHVRNACHRGRVDRRAENGRDAQQLLSIGTQSAGPLPHRAAQRLRKPAVALGERLEHLDHEQRVPACLPQDPIGLAGLAGLAGELPDGIRPERPDLNAAGHGSKRGPDFPVVLRPYRGHHQQPGTASVPGQVMHEFDSRLTRILKVVQHKQHRATRPQLAQECHHAVERPPTLHVGGHLLGGHRPQNRRRLWHQRGEGLRVITQQMPQLRRRPPGDGREKCLHHRLQKQRPLGLVAAGRQDHTVGRSRLRGQRLGQPGLADPRLPNDQDHPWLTTGSLRPRRGQLGELQIAADQPEAAAEPGPARSLLPAWSAPGWVRLPARRPGSPGRCCRKMARYSSWVSGAGSVPSSSASRLLRRAYVSSAFARSPAAAQADMKKR